MKVYSVTWPQDWNGGAARKPDGWWPPQFSEEPLAPSWSPPLFDLDGTFADLQPSNAGVMICSEPMRGLIDRHKASSDRIEWLDVLVRRGSERRTYAIPHFLDELDVLDRSRSIFNRATGDVVRPCIRLEAIDGHAVFTYSRRTGLIFCFTASVYTAIKDCTACSFLNVRVSSPSDET